MKKHHLTKHPNESYSESSDCTQNPPITKEDSYVSSRDWIEELLVFDQHSSKSSKSENAKVQTQAWLRIHRTKLNEESKEEDKYDHDL